MRYAHFMLPEKLSINPQLCPSGVKQINQNLRFFCKGVFKKGFGRPLWEEIVLPGKSLFRKRTGTLASYQPAEKITSLERWGRRC